MELVNQPSAAYKVWSIPILRDAILDHTSSKDRQNIALISWPAFRHIAKKKYSMIFKGEYEELAKKCHSKERLKIYRSAVKLIILDGGKNIPRPGRWIDLKRLFPNLVTINHKNNVLSWRKGEVHRPVYHYTYNDILPLNPKEPIKTLVGIPKSYDQKRQIKLHIRLDNFSHLNNPDERRFSIKNSLYERVKFYGCSPQTLLEFTCTPNHILIEIYSKLLQEGYQPPNYLTLTTANSDLPTLINLLGGGLSELRMFTVKYEDTEINFQDLYKIIDWNNLKKLGFLSLACRRDPPPESDLINQTNDQISELENQLIIPIRKDIKPLLELINFGLKLVYPFETILSPIQLENEKKFIHQIADIVVTLFDWKRFHGDKNESVENRKLWNKLFSVHASYGREDTLGLTQLAEFSNDLNKAFLEKILENISKSIERLDD